ncbi:5-oxoprolinase subunit PxpB [Cupriavidus sp. PET2-C1]
MSRTLETSEEIDSDAQDVPRIHAAGCGALSFDVAGRVFDSTTQRRLWATAEQLANDHGPDGVLDVVPGVNNLLVAIDPLRLHPDRARELLLAKWTTVDANTAKGRDIEIPVVYGGPAREDLEELSGILGMPVHDIVKLHSSAVYTVACIGAMPGFAYLTGLSPELVVPRRATPRAKVEKGAVIIGGTQAGVMPFTAPSGWHILGMTELDMFDADKSPPCLLAPGDRVQFRVREVCA